MFRRPVVAIIMKRDTTGGLAKGIDVAVFALSQVVKKYLILSLSDDGEEFLVT